MLFLTENLLSPRLTLILTSLAALWNMTAAITAQTAMVSYFYKYES